jgi:transposase-like protein
MVVLVGVARDGGRADRRSEGQAHRRPHASSLGHGHDARVLRRRTCRCRTARSSARQGRGKEVVLPSIEALRDGDPMSERVVEQIALGVSTRGYERSLEPVDEMIETRGASKSNASRALIDATTEKLAQFVSRKLDDVDLVAMFIDGIEFAGHSVLIALGVTIDGTKTPLGIWAGSTENTVVVTELLSNLVTRGLRVEHSMLFVIDGGKAIRKALRDVFGDRAIVQRCQVHKARNVRDHLPEARRAYVAKQMRDAYDSATAATAKKKLMQLASWLDSNGEDGAPRACARARRDAHRHATEPHPHPATHLRDDQRDREHERLAPSHRAQRQAMEGREDDPSMGRPRHRGSAEGIPAREGLREHALPRRRHSTHRRDGGAREEGRVRIPTSRRCYAKFNGERGIPFPSRLHRRRHRRSTACALQSSFQRGGKHSSKSLSVSFSSVPSTGRRGPGRRTTRGTVTDPRRTTAATRAFKTPRR